MRIPFRVISFVAAVLVAAVVTAQPVPRPGPAVGDRLTAMKPLLDQRGRPADLTSVAGTAGTLIAVLRSVEW